MAQKSWEMNRRTFLTGAGLALGLPYLECMASAQRAPAARAQLPARMACFYFPFGVADFAENDSHADYGWWPLGDGRTFRFNRTNRALEPFREDVTFLQGFDHPRVRVGGHQSADFFLTGADTRSTNFEFRRFPVPL